MEPNYSWVTIAEKKDEPVGATQHQLAMSKKSIIDIMGAPIEDSAEFKGKINAITYSDTILCISGELKGQGEGDVASNFRYKHDEDMNERVIHNYLYLFEYHAAITGCMPIIVTTIPRSWRKKSFFIRENGTIVSSQPGSDMKVEEYDLMKMLLTFGVCRSKMIKVRESCVSSKYNTYLIDMISFLYQMKIGKPSFHEDFDTTYRKPTKFNAPFADSIHTCPPRMYMEPSMKDGYTFFTPKHSSVDEIYDQLNKALSPEDNSVKVAIRQHCLEYQIERWTDFDANDTDDAFTILMIIHAFTCNEENLGEEELYIMRSLMDIMDPWFTQL
tara:strand:- start:2 stop:988 length:987 start_codon:yes stop_codon:yes gene_type:complete